MLGVRPWGALFFDIEPTLVTECAWRPGARPALQQLHDGGLRLGVIANTGTAMRTEMIATFPAGFGFDLFEDGLVVLSSEVGVQKPDARIFAVALSRAQLAPERTLFAGEDPVEILAAQRIGMRALRLTHPPGDLELLVEAAFGKRP